MSPLTTALAALRAEERQLDAALTKVRQAIDLLSVGPGTSSRTKTAKLAKKAKRKRKPMTAAQKKAVSARMKKYWAKRKKASRS